MYMKINCMDWMGDLPMLFNAFLAFFLIFSLEIGNKYNAEIAKRDRLNTKMTQGDKFNLFFNLMG